MTYGGNIDQQRQLQTWIRIMPEQPVLTQTLSSVKPNRELIGGNMEN